MIRNIFDYCSSSSFRVFVSRKKGNVPNIEWDGVRSSGARAKLLLEAVVGQAMNDGMLSVAMGVRQEPFAAWMKYGGLHGSDSLAWWDMEPPPSGIYPFMYQYLIGAMVITEPPLSGTLKAFIGWNSVELNIVMNGFVCFEISWLQEVIDAYRRIARKAG